VWKSYVWWSWGYNRQNFFARIQPRCIKAQSSIVRRQHIQMELAI
jgi:hypothetical protein